MASRNVAGDTRNGAFLSGAILNFSGPIKLLDAPALLTVLTTLAADWIWYGFIGRKDQLLVE